MEPERIDLPQPTEQPGTPKRKRKRRRPAEELAHRRVKRMAKSGDVEGLMRIFKADNWPLYDVTQVLRLLPTAFEIAARDSPAELAAKVYASMIGFHTSLHYRASRNVEQILARQHQPLGEAPRLDLRTDLTRELLPDLRLIEDHLVGLLQAQADMARCW